MNIYLIALFFLGLLVITHVFGGWSKEYFQEKFLAVIKRNFLKSFFVALISVVGVVGITVCLQEVYSPAFEYSFSIYEDESSESLTIDVDDDGNFIKTETNAEGDKTVTVLGLTKNWGFKKVLFLMNWLLMLYLLPLISMFVASSGSEKANRTLGYFLKFALFYVVFLFFLGSTIASIIVWTLFFILFEYRGSLVARNLLASGLSFNKVDEKYKDIMSPYVFWFLMILLSGIAYVSML